MTEIWKPVIMYSQEFDPHFYTHYEVSNQGRVRNSRTDIILSSFTNHAGYLRINLRNRKVERKPPIHRLVAMAFIGPPPTILHEVNHKDSDKKNNCLGNLEWVTRAENVQHKFRNHVSKWTPEYYKAYQKSYHKTYGPARYKRKKEEAIQE